MRVIGLDVHRSFAVVAILEDSVLSSVLSCMEKWVLPQFACCRYATPCGARGHEGAGIQHGHT